METRNITLSLPATLIRQAKIYAAEHDTTINALVRELMQEALSREDKARQAAARFLEIANRGPYFTTDPGSIRREDLHERD
jgi:plasmid stability protein